MSDKPTCKTCKHYVVRDEPGDREEFAEFPHWEIGHCRRHSPIAGVNGMMGVWPTVRPNYFCGDHEPKDSQ